MRTKYGVAEQEEEWNDVLVIDKKELGGDCTEPLDEQPDVEPVDKATADDPITRMHRFDDQVRNTGLRAVRSLANGGLAVLALGTLSPVGLLLKHLDSLKEDESVGESTEDDNDL